MWMNEYEITETAQRLLERGDCPNLLAVADSVFNLMMWTNQNSDGWPYWSKPSNAAKSAMSLLYAVERRPANWDGSDITPAEARAALRPIKAFRTRQEADFVIVDV